MSREPSMEEILSSIRRVIARDEAARDAALEDRFGGSAETDAVDADAADEDVLDLTSAETLDAPLPTVTDADDPLVSPDSEVAARHALDQLSAALDQGPVNAPAPQPASGTTIEALAEAALRPMLKAWLDTNLPPLVERLVAREIARITGGKL